MSFDIHDVKKVIELYDEDEVNTHLKNNWRLLSVGFNTDSENITSKLYILGTAEDVEFLSKGSKLAKLLEG